MKHPRDILPHHEQKHDRSCIAWGLELVLKMHNRIGLQDYLLQDCSNPCDYGFGPREQQILKDKGINSQQDSLNWKDFINFSYKEVQRGSYPIFTLPLFRYVDLENMAIGTGHHAFVVCDNADGQLIALTMSWKPSKLIQVEHPEKVFQMCRCLDSSCVVNVLSHG